MVLILILVGSKSFLESYLLYVRQTWTNQLSLENFCGGWSFNRILSLINMVYPFICRRDFWDFPLKNSSDSCFFGWFYFIHSFTSFYIHHRLRLCTKFFILFHERQVCSDKNSRHVGVFALVCFLFN